MKYRIHYSWKDSDKIRIRKIKTLPRFRPKDGKLTWQSVIDKKGYCFNDFLTAKNIVKIIQKQYKTILNNINIKAYE